jgi:dipeptidyl aminopeptidase/acylaminoacyl peptidase
LTCRGKLGINRLIEYRTVASGGAARQAILWLPPDYEEGQRLPVIVDLYPGVRLSTFVHAGGFCSSLVSNPHLLNSRGYAVLHPDVLVHGRDASTRRCW